MKRFIRADESEVKEAPKRQGKIKKKIGVKGHEKQKNEKASIFVKLITSHILIGAIPVLVVALIILTLAQRGILDEVQTSNVSLTGKISEIVDMKLSTIETTSKLIVTDLDVLSVVAKNEDDYDDVYYLGKDRLDVIEPMFVSMQISNDYINSIMFVKENEVISSQELSEQESIEENGTRRSDN
ncbi:MAG: hypothetical protein PF505_09735 [Vallitaleaceae bacterium]|jgi:hypothetical protein|nr:hypothetical protein [Vallitaleaceae bacterium]